MLTIHRAAEVRRRWEDDPEPAGDAAVVVTGELVAAVGSLEELRAPFQGARVRTWPGVLGPARVHEGPLPDAPSPRERVHAVLKSGATAVLEEYVDTPELRAAAERNDVLILPGLQPTAIREYMRADLAVFDASGACIATVCAGRLVHRRA